MNIILRLGPLMSEIIRVPKPIHEYRVPVYLPDRGWEDTPIMGPLASPVLVFRRSGETFQIHSERIHVFELESL